MKIAVIGGVAAGMSAAAKARRNSETAVITVYDKDRFVSYSGCTMPYYLSGLVADAVAMVPRDERFFKSWHNIDVKTKTEVLAIDPSAKTITARCLDTGTEFCDGYDKLIIATGNRPFIPGIKGADGAHVFTLKNIGDIISIKEHIDSKKVERAVIIGTGMIGLEVCENLVKAGIKVSLVERLSQVTPNLDSDMAVYIERHIREQGVDIYKSAVTEEITSDAVMLQGGTELKADFVLIAAGARPDTALAAAAGVELGAYGAIKVNDKMQTNIPDIYACGDCAEQYSAITGKAVYYPLGSTANKMGRIAGHNAAGGDKRFMGVLGTSIFKVFEMTAAQTGLNAKQAEQEGYQPQVVYNLKDDRPDIMGGTGMLIKSVADKKTGKLLGAQIIGFDGVDKRIDVLATAISFGANAEQLSHLDLAYAPPYSAAKDAVIYQGMIHDNSINGGRPVMSPQELSELIGSGKDYTLIDVRVKRQFEAQGINTAINIPLSQLRDRAKELDKDALIIVYCNTGVTSNAAQNALINKGFTSVYNLTGGASHYYAAGLNGALR